MDSFITNQFISEQKNTHMTHIEDKVIYGGVEGTRQAINALRALRDMLQGKHKGDISVKWDGAPAIFAGVDPRDGKFFVAKKGIFNKNPKVYKTKADVDADTSGIRDLPPKHHRVCFAEGQCSSEGSQEGTYRYRLAHHIQRRLFREYACLVWCQSISSEEVKQGLVAGCYAP